MYVCVHTWRFQQRFHMRFVFMQNVSRYLFMWYRQIYQGFSSERKILSLSILTILAHISNLFICGCFLCKRSLLTPLVRRRCFCHPLDFLHRKPWFIYFSKLFILIVKGSTSPLLQEEVCFHPLIFCVKGRSQPLLQGEVYPPLVFVLGKPWFIYIFIKRVPPLFC